MFFHHDLKGADLPHRTLCLTYDDGPGRQTLELGRFLYEEGIRAAFFVIGAHAERQPTVLARLLAWGHCLANHTYGHPGLVALAERGGDVVQELWSTDRILQRATGRQPTFFRAPYGNWREKIAGTTQDKATSLVAQQLNTCGELAHYIGPVNWDISAADYDFWQQQSPAEPCAEAYWHEIERLERGIVLMHDSSEDPLVAAANQTLAVTRLLVPRLKANGYHFVGLEEVPQIHHALADALRSS